MFVHFLLPLPLLLSLFVLCILKWSFERILRKSVGTETKDTICVVARIRLPTHALTVESDALTDLVLPRRIDTASWTRSSGLVSRLSISMHDLWAWDHCWRVIILAHTQTHTHRHTHIHTHTHTHTHKVCCHELQRNSSFLLQWWTSQVSAQCLFEPCKNVTSATHSETTQTEIHEFYWSKNTFPFSGLLVNTHKSLLIWSNVTEDNARNKMFRSGVFSSTETGLGHQSQHLIAFRVIFLIHQHQHCAPRASSC